MSWTHQFDEDFAVKYGLHEAIVFEKIRWWVRYNAANEQNYHDGRYWTYNTKDAWQKLVPFLSTKQVRTALDHLREAGVILVGNYQNTPWDRTLFYTVSDQYQDEKPSAPQGQSERPDEAEGSAPQGQSSTTQRPQDNEELPEHAVAPAPAREVPPTRRFSDLFYARDKHKWASGGREGKSLAQLVKWAKSEQPARWEEYLLAFMDGAWALKQGELVGMTAFDKHRWATLAYTPSGLLGAHGNIMAALENIQHKPIDADEYARAALAAVK